MFPPKPDELVCDVSSFQTWSFQAWNLRVEDLRMQAVSVSAVRTLNLYWGTDPAAVSRSRPPIGIQLAQHGWSLLLCLDAGEKDEWKCKTPKLRRVFICLSVCFIQPQCNFQYNFPRSWISFHTEHCRPAMEYRSWYFWLFAVTVYAAHNITCPQSSLMPRPLEARRLFWVIVSICPLSPTSPC